MGLIGAGGTLDILIPPSSILILYGAVSGDSISDLYIAGSFPGSSSGLPSVSRSGSCAGIRAGEGPQPTTVLLEGSGQKARSCFWVLLMPVIINGRHLQRHLSR